MANGASPDSRWNLEPGGWPPRPGASGSVRITRRTGGDADMAGRAMPFAELGRSAESTLAWAPRCRPGRASRRPARLHALGSERDSSPGWARAPRFPFPPPAQAQACARLSAAVLAQGLPWAAEKPGRRWERASCSRCGPHRQASALPTSPAPAAGPGPAMGRGRGSACDRLVC